MTNLTNRLNALGILVEKQTKGIAALDAEVRELRAKVADLKHWPAAVEALKARWSGDAGDGPGWLHRQVENKKGKDICERIEAEAHRRIAATQDQAREGKDG